MQQVNLFRRGDMTAASARVLAGRTVLGMLGLVALTLCGITVFAHLRLQRLDGQLASLRGQQAEQTARFEHADALMVGKTPEQIDRHVESLAGALAERNAALRALQAGSAGDAQGFAARFEALSRAHIDGLWLVSMSIDSPNRAVALVGNALDPDLVPRYLESLSRQPAFAGTRFSHLRIEREAARASLRFEVATSAPITTQEEGP